MQNVSRTPINFCENKPLHIHQIRKLKILVTLSVGEDSVKWIILGTAGVLSNKEEKGRTIYLPSSPEMSPNVSYPFLVYRSFQINSSFSSKNWFHLS